jgi:hypothetical protein
VRPVYSVVFRQFMVIKIGAVAVVQSETGTELGSSDPAVKCEKSDRGALIKLNNLGRHLSSEIESAELARSPVGNFLAKKCK